MFYYILSKKVWNSRVFIVYLHRQMSSTVCLSFNKKKTFRRSPHLCLSNLVQIYIVCYLLQIFTTKILQYLIVYLRF